MSIMLIAGLLAALLAATPRAQAAMFDLSTCDPDPLVNGGYLIVAITAANSNGTSDTIQLGACTYRLSSTKNIVDGANGLPSIQADGGSTLTIVGASAATTSIERTAVTKDSFRIFHIAAGATVAISNLTISNGLARGADGVSGETATDGTDGMGGAIYNHGMLTLTNVILEGNQAIGGTGGASMNTDMNGAAGLGRGGAIMNTATGSLELDAVVLRTNSATGGRGGDRTGVPSNFSFSKRGGAGQGGAIYTQGSLAISGGALNGNQAIGGQSGNISGEAPFLYGSSGGNGYGGAIYIQAGSAGLTTVQIQSNTIVGGAGGSGPSSTGPAGSGEGGAIYTSAPLSISGSTISDNSVPDSDSGGGGAILVEGDTTIDSTSFQRNSSPGGFGGGALLIFSSTLTVTASLFDNNTAGTGGAIASGGEDGPIVTQIHNSMFISNTAEYEGGAVAFFGEILTISGSTFADNQSTNVEGSGGAIASQGSLSISNSTISGNRTRGSGGGLYVRGGNADLDHVTISANVADSAGTDSGDGGGLANSGTTTVANTIVAGNFDTPSNSGAGTIAPDVSGAIASGGYNLIGDGTGSSGFTNGTNGDQVGTAAGRIDPLLGPLQTNGGATLTHALLIGSPAIDAGDPTYAPPPNYDQRGTGFDRISNGRIDIGAFEVQVISTTPGIELTPSPLTFGNQTINTTSTTQFITLHSSGTAPLQVSSITISGDFAIVASSAAAACPASPPAFTLEPGSSCTIGVSFTPTATGPRNGALRVADDASGSPHAVALSGTGVTRPSQTIRRVFLPIVQIGGQADLAITSLSISPSKQSYTAGETVQISVTVTNQGNAPTTGAFWVDLYVNPARPPTINTLWSDVCGISPCVGVAWPVLTTLAPGQSITLTTTRASYDQQRSFWLGWLPSGTTQIYALADSWNTSGNSGTIDEVDEANNLARIGELTVTGTNPPYEPWPGLAHPYVATPGALPARPLPYH
jgi:predicted outer membrane repeat protein